MEGLLAGKILLTFRSNSRIPDYRSSFKRLSGNFRYGSARDLLSYNRAYSVHMAVKRSTRSNGPKPGGQSEEPSINETMHIVLKYGKTPVRAFCALLKGGKPVIEVNLHNQRDRPLVLAYFILLWIIYVPFHLLRCALVGPRPFWDALSAIFTAAVDKSDLDAGEIEAGRRSYDDNRDKEILKKNVFQVASDFKRHTNYKDFSWRSCRYSSLDELAKDLIYHAAYALAELRVRGTNIQPDMQSLQNAIGQAKKATSKRSATVLLSGNIIAFLDDLRTLNRLEIMQILKLRLNVGHHIRFWDKGSAGLKSGVSDLRARRVSLAICGRLSKDQSDGIHAVYGVLAGVTNIRSISASDIANVLLCESLTESFVKDAEFYSSEELTIKNIDFLKTRRPKLDIDTSCWAGSYDSADYSYPGKVTFDLSHRGCEDLGEFAGSSENVEKMIYLVRYGRSEELLNIVREYDAAINPNLSEATMDELRMLQLTGRTVRGNHSCLWRILQGSDHGKACILPELSVGDVREHLHSEHGRTVYMYKVDTPIKITAIGGRALLARADQSSIPDGIDDLILV